MTRTTRLRTTALTLLAVGALVAGVFAPTGLVGAVFTAGRTTDRLSVGAATIAPLSGGSAIRTANGTASVVWKTPDRADRAVYTM